MERILIRSQDLLQGIPAEVSDRQIGEGYTAVVLSADAQATVEALQAQLREGEAAYHNVGEYNDRLKQQVEALQRELEHAKKMEAVQKEVADNQTWHVRELRAALDAEREKVRTVEHELARIVKRNQGGYIGDRIAIDKCLTIIRTLDATTPAGGVVAGKGLYQGNGEAT